ncbi:MAG TPA: cache domain-containing protein [Candidatus Methylomirabilis sp.]|nr:cache domain-containing protein [Candidatus Methylomirabilis sp.]
MPRLSFSSLRVRLSLLVLLAVVPTVGLLFYTNLEQRHRSAEDVTTNALRIAKLIAGIQAQRIEEVHGFLIDLADLPEVRARDPRACNEGLARMLRYSPSYASLGVLNLEGDWLCSAKPLSQMVSAADRTWFQRTIQSRAFSVGKYQIDTNATSAEVHFGYPVIDDRGRIQTVITAALDLDWLNALTAKEQLPEWMDLTVVDCDGIILARDPEPEKWVGRVFPEDSIVKAMLTGREGVKEVTGVDGIPRVFAIVPVRAGSQVAMYVSIGVPKAVAFADADRVLTYNLIGVGVVTVLVLASAWIGGSVFVLRNVKALVSVTRRLAAGDLSARTGMSHGPGELRQLAHAFDEMAVSLEQAEAERKGAEERLRDNAEHLQALSRRLVEIQESERRQIARELHDEIGEILTGLKLSLEMSARMVSGQVASSLGEAQVQVQDLMNRTRDLSLDLRPAILDDLGLLPALLWHFERYTGQTGVRVTFDHNGLEERVAPDLETAVYRIVQEALTNAARHAGVQDVSVRMRTAPETLSVQIEDQGAGFEAEAKARSHDSSGLTGMRERALLLGGHLKVESCPGVGTRVVADFPLNPLFDRE